MPALLLAFLLYAAPAEAKKPARPAAPPAQLSVSTETDQTGGTPQELVPMVMAVMAETEPLFEQLSKLEQRYQEPGSLGRSRDERKKLRKTIEAKIERFTSLYADFEDRRRLNETMKIQGALAQFMGGR